MSIARAVHASWCTYSTKGYPGSELYLLLVDVSMCRAFDLKAPQLRPTCAPTRGLPAAAMHRARLLCANGTLVEVYDKAQLASRSGVIPEGESNRGHGGAGAND